MTLWAFNLSTSLYTDAKAWALNLGVMPNTQSFINAMVWKGDVWYINASSRTSVCRLIAPPPYKWCYGVQSIVVRGTEHQSGVGTLWTANLCRHHHSDNWHWNPLTTWWQLLYEPCHGHCCWCWIRSWLSLMVIPWRLPRTEPYPTRPIWSSN